MIDPPTAIAVDLKDDDVRAAMSRIALLAYANEPCRICGEVIDEKQVETAVFAGYSQDNTSRAAHKGCWDKKVPAEQWAKK